MLSPVVPGQIHFYSQRGDTGFTVATADVIADFATISDRLRVSTAAGDATIADGSALANEAAFISAANTVLRVGAGTDDVYVAWNAAGSGDAWAVVDENDSGSVDAGDTFLVLTGINLVSEIAVADFI